MRYDSFMSNNLDKYVFYSEIIWSQLKINTLFTTNIYKINSLSKKYIFTSSTLQKENTKSVIKLTNLVFFDFLENKKW